MDSQFSAASNVSTFRRGHKRRRNSKLEFPLQSPRSESHLGGAGTDMQNGDGTRDERELEPPAKRGRRCARKQREQFCEENQRKLRSTVNSSKDSVLNTASDRSSCVNAGLEMKQERTGTGRYLFRKQNNSGSQGTNSLNLQATSPAKRNRLSRDSEIPVSPDYVRLVQQMESDESYARSLQAEFDREIEQSRSVAAERSPVSHSDVSVSQGLMTSEVASTSQNSNLETARPNVRAGRRIRPTLRSQSNNSSSFQYLLDAETMTEGNELTVTFLDSMNNEMGVSFDPLHFSFIHRNIAGFNYFLRDPLNIGAGLDSCGLSTAQINRLPTHMYETGDHRERFETSECQICLCAYEQGVKLRTLPCFHEFHHSCIDKWLKMNRSCPVCRSSVAVDSSDQ